MKKYIFYGLLLLSILISIFNYNVLAENKKSYIREGNKQYENKKYNEAEINYRKSLELDSSNYKALYNLGNALYKQNNLDSAINNYFKVANQDLDSTTLAKVHHNMGNAFLQKGLQMKKSMEEAQNDGDFERANKLNEESRDWIRKSIAEYKKALKNNPNDEDTKYNLSYANKLLKALIQQNQQQQNKKDQQKDKQNQQDQKQQQQSQQNQQDKTENKQKQSSQQQQPKISKEDAQRMLQALQNQEKNTQKKRAKILQGGKYKPEKNW